MTHRVFSRNASSSRAIPVAKLIADVEAEPVVPIHWGKNQPGMQANEEIPPEARPAAQATWLLAMQSAVAHARELADMGVHKQIVNRILEPYAHINVVLTATEWDNFYRLRLDADAQPEIHELAQAMSHARDWSQPVLLGDNEWHLPFIQPADLDLPLSDQLRVSAARCARVSYKTHQGTNSGVEQDLKLALKLMTSGHWSPLEHQATPDPDDEAPFQHGNFRGWRQHRLIMEQLMNDVS